MFHIKNWSTSVDTPDELELPEELVLLDVLKSPDELVLVEELELLEDAEELLEAELELEKASILHACNPPSIRSKNANLVQYIALPYQTQLFVMISACRPWGTSVFLEFPFQISWRRVDAGSHRVST